MQALALFHHQCEGFFHHILIFHLIALEQDLEESGVNGGRNPMVSNKRGFALIKRSQTDI